MNESTVLAASMGLAISIIGSSLCAGEVSNVADAVIAAQRVKLAQDAADGEVGPQSPRDLRIPVGDNPRVFSIAPPHTRMHLCNIHLHKGAEHAGGEFTTFLGNGDGKGFGTGFGYNGQLTDAELAPLATPVGSGHEGLLAPGDTIEVHYVHTTTHTTPGPTLHYCIDHGTSNPQLRVETQVMVLVNDPEAADFTHLAAIEQIGAYWQAPHIPTDTGKPIQYIGSTTGPSYNEAGSPFQVTWSVRPKVMKVDIASLAEWYEHNIFDEHHAHGVRNLVINPKLLSPISD